VGGVSPDQTPPSENLAGQDFVACVAFVAFVFNFSPLKEK
jgi:hypothetical protein